ncbi:flavodoxin [Christensenella tenuis]|uniref:NAD(P)H-dependent oxidoreductase n=1 Tax=Christensenella tenuis TaxID=2763033 RepID=A0ABR7ED50_9FIRM|nr:flavodoxin [Christensenella tenuis]MBC5647707.1 NAD(P)H-dependent oxidoreductase [Christensenella tenuis]
MKKVISFIISTALGLTLAACSATTPEPDPAASSLQPAQATATQAEEVQSQPAAETSAAIEPQGSAANSLIVYFSWSGNTQAVANEIQTQTGADVFEIVPEEPYTDDYDALLDIAQEEQQNDARPAIAGNIENIENYEVIYLGFPNWWGDMPMILYSFLDDYDLSGKTIAPFVTSGGSGFSGTISVIENMEPGATVLEGLSLGSSEAADSGNAVAQWLSSIGTEG